MAALWFWALLLSQLAAWGSAAPQKAERELGKALGDNAPGISSHHQQLSSAHSASGTTIGSADHNSLQVIQNQQPVALQQASVKQGTENLSVNSQSGVAGSSNTDKEKVIGQTGISNTLSNPAELKQREDPPVQTETVQGNPKHLEESGTDKSALKKLKQPEEVERKNQNLQPGLSIKNPTSAKEVSSDVASPQKQTSPPKPKTTELKQGENQSIKNPDVKPDPDQDPSGKNPPESNNAQENPVPLEESETEESELKKLEQSEDVDTKDQNLQPGLSIKNPTSGKVDSSDVTSAQRETSVPKPKTTELKQGEDQSIKTPNAKPGGPDQAENKKTDTDISESDLSQLETNDEESQQMEDPLENEQDLQSDLSVKHPPLESQKVEEEEEEEAVDPGDEQEKGLGDEQKKGAKHEEDSEGTPKNGSENSHFFAYLVTTAIVVAALYIAYHNKRKIIAFALEGKKSKTSRRPKSSDYQRLDQKI